MGIPKDYKRHLKSDMKGNFVEIEKPKSKSVPREIEHSIFLSMVVERDRVLYNEAKNKGDIATMEFLKKRHNG